APKKYRPHHQEIIDAMNSVDFDFVNSRSDAGDILKKDIREESVVQFLLKNIYWKEKDKLGWRFNLDLINEKYDNVADTVSEGQYQGPVLFIRGEKSNYIRPETDQEKINEYFP